MCWSNLQADHEGFSAGSLGGLEAIANTFSARLTDKIRVPDQYVTAIETALGHHLQLVLTEYPNPRSKSSRTSARIKEGAPA